MEIKNRLFPYPVLSEENDDYIDSVFSASFTVDSELNDFLVRLNVTLENCDEIGWLIRDGIADVVIHIECSSTAYRTFTVMNGNSKTFKISKSRVNNEVYLVAMIVAKKDIVEFTSSHLNEDYQDEVVDFKKGAILGYVNMGKFAVVKNYEELAGDSAFFTIIKRTTQNSDEVYPVTYEISDHKIKILVDEKTYDEYVKYHGSALMEPITNTLLVMPALAYMVETVRENGTDPYVGLYWYQKISKSCQVQGKNFVEDIIDNADKTSLEIAQELLKYPISRAFENLSRVIEE